MDLSTFDMNDKLSLEGQWVPIGSKAELLIARMNNEKYREAIKRQSKPYRGAIRAGTVDEELMLSIVIKATARHILLGWKGLTEKGVEVPYTIEKAEQLLKEKEAFRELVMALAQDNNLFQEAELEDAEKN